MYTVELGLLVVDELSSVVDCTLLKWNKAMLLLVSLELLLCVMMRERLLPYACLACFLAFLPRIVDMNMR